MQRIVRVRTRRAREVVDLTAQVVEVVAAAKVAEGIAPSSSVTRQDRRQRVGAPQGGGPGPSEAIPVRDGRLLPGTWQGIALVEWDGPRMREIVIDVRA